MLGFLRSRLLEVGMLWLFLTIATAFIWASFDLISKFLISNELNNPSMAAAVVGVEMFSLYSIISIIFGDITLNTSIIIPGILGGFAYFLANYTYYHGMAKTEVSRFAPLLATNSIFIAIIAYFTIGESFNLIVYIGIISTVVGAYIISLENPRKTFTVLESKYGFIFGLSTAFLFAVRDIFVKSGTNQTTLLPVLIWFGVGGVIPSIILMYKNRSAFDELNMHNMKLLLPSSILLVAGYFVFTKAISLGPVSLASAVVKVKLLLVVSTSFLITKFRTGVLNENFKKTVLLQKVFASALVISGLVLISLYN